MFILHIIKCLDRLWDLQDGKNSHATKSMKMKASLHVEINPYPANMENMVSS